MLRLYNTLTRRKEVFKPIKPGEVRMYSCGPTVYDYVHIGNFRAFITSDLLKRYLLYKGFKIKHVMNLTDVDDKTIKRARETKIPLKQLTEKYANAFFEDLKKLNILPPDVFCKATEHIPEMIELIKKLIKKGLAYPAEDGIYFDVSAFKGYGKLSRLKLKKLKPGARVRTDLYAKKQAQDFALWKFWDPEDGNVYWQAPFGLGRPGWHIECSAMSMKYLGEHFDVHTGGVDLIFPHHENEIAQSEGVTGKKFVNFWFHNEWLLVEGKRMSKSLGNFYTLHDLLKKGYTPRETRYVLLAAHYRQQLNFKLKSLEKAKETLKRLDEFVLKLQEAKGEGIKQFSLLRVKQNFEAALDDDLNIVKALAVLFDFIRETNKVIEKLSESQAREVYALMLNFDKVLGLSLERVKPAEQIPRKIKQLVEKREKARSEKDFKKADRLRAEIRKLGWVVEDTAEGPRLKRERCG